MILADIHGDLEMVEKSIEYANNNGIDDIILLGDFPAYGNFRDKEMNLKWGKRILNLLNKKFNLMAIPGNCDSEDIIREFDKMGINLHAKVKEIHGVSFIGFGGATKTPFNTPFELNDEIFYNNLKDLMKRVKTDDVVLILHQPPINTKCDLTRNGIHAGNSGIRRIIEEFQPSFAVCSHIHEAGGNEDIIGKTRIYNVGSISDGRFGILDLSKPSIKLYRFDDLDLMTKIDSMEDV